MANHREHLIAGAAAGVGICLLAAVAAGRKISISELIGAAVSGMTFSTLPDILEPAIHPNHRSTFHSLGFIGAAAPPAWKWSEEKMREHRGLAETSRTQAAAATSQQERNHWQMMALVHDLAAGFFVGIVPGYVSHLLADSLTPKGLPIL
jgi:membrane-bound metal-dependent hydrolase YbcI (DUF457 family)